MSVPQGGPELLLARGSVVTALLVVRQVVAQVLLRRPAPRAPVFD